MVTQAIRRVVTYERVSSEDQRDRQTIKTQTEELARRLDADPHVRLVDRYVDDGVSGTIPFSQRSGGRRLLEAAARGAFDEVWVYKIDRLGRDDVDPLVIWRQLEELGIKVHSVTEGASDPLVYAIHVAIAAQERRTFLARSQDGMNRAAKEGRYVGGIVPLGYQVQGKKPHARLVPDNTPMWGGLTAAQIVARIFEESGRHGRSARKIADQFNKLGVPTSYQRDGRGIRGKRTQGIWRPGRVLQILKNTSYYGEYCYGKRSKKPDRQLVKATIPALISRELWDAAQETLKMHARRPPDQRRTYLLRSLLKCALCGLNYTGTVSNGRVWYRCNGQLAGRGPLAGRCPAKGVPGDVLEAAAQLDIEAWLRNPGDLLDELVANAEDEIESEAAALEAERIALGRAIADVAERENRILDLYIDGRFNRRELDERLAKLKSERDEMQCRLDDLPVADESAPELVPPDLAARLAARLDEGLSDEIWHEVVSLLVDRITIHTTVLDERRKSAKAVIEYRFSPVVPTVTGTPEGLNYTKARRVVNL